MEDPESGRPLKRFKHQSYQETLKTVHLPSASAQTKFDEDIPDSNSHFRNALDQWRQLNLSPSFIRFAGQVQGLSESLPLLVHHSQEIVLLWTEAATDSNDDALKALLDLLEKLVHDLRDTLLPSYTSLLNTLLALLSTALSAEILVSILTTLSLLFKILLNPNPHFLAESWSLLVDVLPRHNYEVQRALAEVWATVLRRFKGHSSEDAVGLLMRDAEKVPDACAWVLVYTFKSVSHTLHSSTPMLFDILLSAHLSVPNRVGTETLMRRVITALVHHCEKAEQFLPISDLLVTRLTTVTSHEELPFLMGLVTVSCSVRKGSRMTQKQVSTILSFLAQTTLPSDFQNHILRLATSAILAAEMSVWMGPGRKFVEVSWESYTLGLELSGALSELGWTGWVSVELPFTLKYTAQYFDVHPRPTLKLLAVLASCGRLDDAEHSWVHRMSLSLQTRLETLDVCEEKQEELNCIFSLSRLLPLIVPGILRIGNNVLDASENGNIPNETRAFLGTTFGSCLRALANSPNKEWAQQIDIHSLVIRAVRSWGSCESVVSGLVAIIQQSAVTAPISFAEVFPSLQESILSHSHKLRLHALEILATPIVDINQSYECMQRCLQGEKASLDVQGVRERVLSITGLPRVVKEGDGIGSNICTRWLIAQLKVNLRPLWVPAIKALGALSHSHGESVWRLVFEEVERVIRGDLLPGSSPATVDEVDGNNETERTWRDPSALRFRSTVERWSRGIIVPGVAPPTSLERLDVPNYEVQLLHVLGEIAPLSTKHNAGLVRLFFSFASPELPSKPSRKRLLNWLTLFSKLDNPKAFYQSSILLSFYRSQLSHPDRDLQLAALTCILNYKSPHLVPYEANLRALLDITKWRDELTSFNIAEIGDVDRTEAIDVIVRLFFGLMMERHGRTRNADKRASLLDALGGCREEELKPLVDLMLEPFPAPSVVLEIADRQASESMEKQWTGFMNLLGDVLKRMGSRLLSYWPSLLTMTIYLTTRAQVSLDTTGGAEKLEDEDGEVDDNPDQEMAQLPSKNQSKRVVRQLGIKRFTDFFRWEVTFDFKPYLPVAFSGFISPRLAALNHENTQSPSAIINLFHAWSTHREYVHFLVDHDNRILPQTYACLKSVNVKPVVVSRVFDIIENIIFLSEDDSHVADLVLKPHISSLLDALVVHVPTGNGGPGDLLHRQVGILSQISKFVSTPSQAKRLLQHFLPLLKRPSKVISEKTKAHLLKIIQNVIPTIPEFQDHTSVTYIQIYDLFSKLFQTLRWRLARTALLEAFHQLSIINTDLQRVSNLLASLNAFSVKRIDEPDFDRRMQAFASLNEDLYAQLHPSEWQPILFNIVQFIQDPEELSIRTSAAFSLKRYIDILSSGSNQEMETLYNRVLYPGLKHSLLSKNESIRNEVLGVLAYGVANCSRLPLSQELRPLLANGDQEANFFNNLYHTQIHRRTRAVRRLVEYIDSGSIRSTILSDIFVPLIGHFITNAPTTDHILVDVAITATGSVARHLSWGSYNALVRRYMKLIKEKTLAERACVRALVAILENFHFPMEDVVVEEEALNEGVDEKIVEDDPVPVEDTVQVEAEKSSAGSSMKKIADAVIMRLLPSLIQHLEGRDVNEDALRIPVSIGIVQVARHLPTATRDSQISRILTVLSQVFRSKSRETRTLTRETLCKIAVILGPSYLHPIIMELRAALQRGPHLHILATVVHALLVHVTAPGVTPSFDNLDACVADVAHISAEILFGQSGNDVRAEGFKTDIPEVRGSSSKSLNAFAILAKYISSANISTLLQPIRAIMHETEALKVLQVVDDVLRRVSGGLNANLHITPPELLLLCYTLIQQDSRFLKEATTSVTRKRKDKGRFLVQTERNVGKAQDHYAHTSFRFVAFGLDLFNTAIRRGRFDFQDANIISRLEPMVDVIGNTLYSQETLVVIQGLKATAAIVRCPLKSIDNSLPAFVSQTLNIVRQAGNTESEMVQSAFRTLSVIIRDCAASHVSEQDLAYLLEVLTPDLEEPNRQAAVFALLRAIVSRKFVVAEIYEIMDKVAEIMVTNQSSQVQELCRAVFLQFLLDYPHGKGRLHNQMTFLAQNLSYTYESGRRSVMELLNAIFTKFEPSLLREYADLLFVALVLVIANDDSSKCREMAAELIKTLLKHLDEPHHKIIMSHLRSWSSQKTRLQLSMVSIQVCGIVVDTLQHEITQYLPGLLEDLNNVLRRSAAELHELEFSDVTIDVDVEWQMPYQALNVISKVLQVQPELTKVTSKIDWPAISSHLLFPHAWVRKVSSRLIGILLNANPVGAPDPNLPDDSLISLAGLIEIARTSSLQLKSEALDSSLSLQVVKNLLYIGKCFCGITVDGDAVELDPNEIMEEISNAEEANVVYDAEDKLENIRSNPLSWLFSRLSYQTRTAWISRRNRSVGQDNWSEQPSAIFRWFAAMASHMAPAMLETFLVHILSPVYRVIDDDTVRDAQMGNLRTLAQELVELIQSKVETTNFLKVYNQIRQGIVAVRRERKAQRSIQVAVDPQSSARRKIKQNLAKRVNRARKDRVFAETKIRNNPTKRRRVRE